jgi:peroxiredoxin
LKVGLQAAKATAMARRRERGVACIDPRLSDGRFAWRIRLAQEGRLGSKIDDARSIRLPMKKILYAAATALALAVGVGVYLNTGVSAAPASNFVLLDGSKRSTDDLKGKVTLVNFWATSCVTCVGEMPKVIATYDKYKDRGYDTLAVAMSYDPPSYVVNFAETRKLPFKVAIDNTGAVAKAWGDVQLTPTTYVVNKRGEIVKRYVGEPDFAELHKLIEKLLAEA